MLFDDTCFSLMVQMPIMQEIDMIAMLDSRVPAVVAMDVGMIHVIVTHESLLQIVK